MFNLKEIKKVFLATFLLIAMVVFASPSYAEIDCSTETSEYNKRLCEERKALAAKGEKSQNKIKEAQEKLEKAKQANENGTTKADKKAQKKSQEALDSIQKYNAANKGGAVAAKNADGTYKITIKDDSDQRISEANKKKEQASRDLASALQNGNTEGAKQAQDAMVAANNDINDAKKDAKEYEKVKKAIGESKKAEEKAEQKAKKVEAKAEKKIVKTAEKAEKSAAKNSEKADKEVAKLQKKCEKNPDKCDTSALQAALAKQEAAKAAAEAAKTQRETLDGTAEERERAAAAAAVAEADVANKLESAGDTEAEALNADKQGQAEAAAKPKRCAEAKGVFEIIACKAITTLADLRQVVYLFAGFGLIAFAWGAIFNKISWKHFSQIAFALFLLSMMGSFIRYFSYDADRELMFGKYLMDDHEHTKAGADGPSDCDKKVEAYYQNLESNSGKAYDALGDCPIPIGEVVVTAPKKKWSLKDLKGTVQAGIGAIQKANSAYQTVKSTVENVVSQAQTIGNAIKNGEGGLTGILNTMNTVATASGSIMNSGQLMANNLAANVGGFTEDIKNAGMTNKEREQRTKDKARLDTLTKMCDGGACSGDGPNAKKLRSELEMLKGKESTQDTAVNKWLKNDEKGGGATIMAGIKKVGNIGNAATNTVRAASNAAQNGATIGGGIGSGTGDALGAIFGLATAAGDITSAGGNPNFDFKSAGTKRAEKAATDKAVFEKSSGFVASSKKEGDKNIEVRGDGSTKIVDGKTGTTTIKGKDGSVVTTTNNGSKVEVRVDGTKIVTNSNGKVTTTTPDGKTTTDESNIKVKYSGDASVKDSTKPKSTPAPATPAPATKAPATPAPATKAPATKASATPAPATPAPATKASAVVNNSSQSKDEYKGPLLRSSEGVGNIKLPNIVEDKKVFSNGSDTIVKNTTTQGGVTVINTAVYKDTVRNADGSVSQKDAQGRISTSYPDGRVVIKDENGKITYDSAVKK